MRQRARRGPGRLRGSLADPGSLPRRCEALDRLESLALSLEESGPDRRDRALVDRIAAIRANLEAANEMLFRSIRDDIRRGAGAAGLLAWAPPPGPHGNDVAHDRGGYDHLDTLISGVLRFVPIDDEVPDIRPEMVAYQPTPARHIFDLVRRASPGPNDVFVDIGSGLGHVPMVVSICTGARSIGIEIEPIYAECAQRTAAELGLRNVTFLRADAREADLSEGTIFYLYSPCIGSMLRSVLDRLRAESERRAIRVCTMGPCAHDVAREGWLVPEGTVSPERPTVFRRRHHGL